MGCATSKPKSLPDTSVPQSQKPSAPGAPSAPASASRTTNSAPSPSPRSGGGTPSKPSYDTQSSASLVDGSSSTVAYHGLLADSGKLNLSRTPALGALKVFAKDSHPDHDSHVAGVEGVAAECTRVAGVAMTMPYTIIVAQPECEKTLENIARGVFDDASNLLNGWNPESEISKLNRAKPGKSVPLSPGLAKLLDIVDDVHELSDARFDPTTGVLTVAFENCIAENGRPPLPAELTPFRHALGWKRRVQRSKGVISRGNGNVVIDLDGLSKGYVIDMIVEALVRQGFKDCYVDWAGDIRASGKHPSGRPWRSAVMRPPGLPRVFGHWKDRTMKDMLKEDDIGLIATFDFAHAAMDGERFDGAIATSGDYFAVQKYGYHHIAQPDTMALMKANQNSVGTVCVAAETCAFADALATAAMTFNNPDEAVQFLKRIHKDRPGQLYGFCVLGRKSGSEDEKSSFTSSIFEPVTSSDENSSSGVTEEPGYKDDGASMRNSEIIHKNVIRNRYEVRFNGKSVQLDNFVPCSMEPEQIISMVLPKEFVESSSLSSGEQLNRFSCKFLSPLSQAEPAKSRDTGMHVDLCFKHISYLNDSAMVVAAIKAVRFGADESVQAEFRGSVIPKQQVSLGVPRSKIPFLPLVEQSKLLFRQIPSMLWVVATNPAHSSDVAFTATSPSAPASSPNILSFNVAHSSAFFAAFGGVGSAVRLYALSTLQKDLADRYVKNSSLLETDLPRFERESMLTAHCTVEHVENFQDHLLVLASIEGVDASNDFGLTPLVWMNGTFLN